MFEITGTGAAPAVTAPAVDASGVAMFGDILFCAAAFGRGLVAAGVDDDAAGNDSVIDGVVADEEAAADEFRCVDVDNTAVIDESCEIAAAAPVICAGALLVAVVDCDNATLCALFWTTLMGLATVAIVD